VGGTWETSPFKIGRGRGDFGGSAVSDLALFLSKKTFVGKKYFYFILFYFITRQRHGLLLRVPPCLFVLLFQAASVQLSLELGKTLHQLRHLVRLVAAIYLHQAAW
jgi:hypothetical protein